MDDVKGILCSTCTAAFQGKTRRVRLVPLRNYYMSNWQFHHEDYDSFVASKSLGCCICNWLWLAHTRPPGSDSDSDSGSGGGPTGLKDFQISCNLRMPEELTPRLLFIIRCAWARDCVKQGTFARPNSLSLTLGEQRC